jgi:hypothetical protein
MVYPFWVSSTVRIIQRRHLATRMGKHLWHFEAHYHYLDSGATK